MISLEKTSMRSCDRKCQPAQLSAGNAGSAARLCYASENPHFSQKRREMGHPGWSRCGRVGGGVGVPSWRLCWEFNRTARFSSLRTGQRWAMEFAPACRAFWPTNWMRTGSRYTFVQADGDEAYGSQDTDGSHSVREFFDTLREAGATARLMLVRAAAQQWGVPESQCVADPVHVVSDKGSSRKLGYGELATLAAKQPVPKKEELQVQVAAAMALHRQACAGVRRDRGCVRASRCLAWTFAWTGCFMQRSRIRRCWEGRSSQLMTRRR